jgi:glycosyltransferase involved in cell wall biosynthesis
VGWPAIIVPVRDGADLLPFALPGLVSAAEEMGGRVLVVDDASTDQTAAAATAGGAAVIRLDAPSGPYVARNAGWERAAAEGADVAVFVDARCRPRPAWLPNLLGALRSDGAAMAAGEVVVLPRPHLAGRAAAVLEPLAMRHGRHASFLPYAPTCHLAVPIARLQEVGGFRAVRGGGDVDLCWRLQLAGAGTIAWSDDAVLDWEPRRRVRDLLAQHRRYGANTARLCLEYRDRGCPVTPAVPLWRVCAHHARAVATEALRGRPSGWPALAVAHLARVAQERGYSEELRRSQSGTGTT